jgi:penicillin-binding protein 1A
VVTLARAAGVRHSKLEPVLSLALGTSPVTLREMVVAYATLANEGRYVEPVLVTRVEDKNGRVLQQFAPALPEQAVSANAAMTVVDVLRGVVDRGTGTAIRQRFGIQADVAGKTGTTQDNTDGWFILMHPQLVAGAWVGFNDNRITMGDAWGPGARSALPMVGDFYQQAFKAQLIDAKVRFGTLPPEPVPIPTLPQEANAGAVSAFFPSSSDASAPPAGGAEPDQPVAAVPVTLPAPVPAIVVIPETEPDTRPGVPTVSAPAPAPAPRTITIARPQVGTPAQERGPRVFAAPSGALPAASRSERPSADGGPAAAEVDGPLRQAVGRAEASGLSQPVPARGDAGAIEGDPAPR